MKLIIAVWIQARNPVPSQEEMSNGAYVAGWIASEHLSPETCAFHKEAAVVVVGIVSSSVNRELGPTGRGQKSGEESITGLNI